MATLLRVLIDRNGWQHYPEFARRYERAAAELGARTGDMGLLTHSVSRRTFERWYAGEVQPQHDARRVLAHLFQRPISDLTASATPDAAGPGALRTSVRIDPGADPHQMGQHAAMAAKRALEFAMGAERGDIGEQTLAYLQDEIRRLAATYVRVPLNRVLDDLVEAQEAVFRLLEGDRARPSQARDLYVMAAVASGMLAKASHDLGDPRSAMMQSRTAAICADRAEHQPLQAWISGLQSLIAYWAGRPEDAAHYARRGQVTATALTGSVSVWLPSLHARAAALLGDRPTAHAALDRARDARDHTAADDLDRIGGLLAFPTIRQDYYTVEAHVLLRDTEPGLVAQAEATSRAYTDPSHPDWAIGDAAGAHANLALARLHTGDLDGAADALRPVLDMPAEQRSAGVVHSAHRVRTALTAPLSDAAAGRQLREEIAAFSRPALALPRG